MPRREVLAIEDLTVYYYTLRGIVHAVEDVSLRVNEGEMLALVGESGSGKSTLGYAILKLVPPPGRIVRGRVLVDGIDIVSLKGEKLRRARGELVSIVFQDPFTTLDPVRRVGEQIEEVLVEHGVPVEEARKRVGEILEAVGLPSHMARSYPHQLSGGQRQRVSIAAAVALNPRVLVADEPTTALDVIVQKQVMDVLDEIRRRHGTTMILITHDIALAAERADKIAVMYAGHIVEVATKKEIIENPLHPYTRGLIASVPDVSSEEWPKPIPGNPPDLRNPPPGCRFHPRCPEARDICKRITPRLYEPKPGHLVACHLYG
ncbi:MAG: ABC transporter ATP-binding protein [Pyrodictiaceae archaeon]